MMPPVVTGKRKIIVTVVVRATSMMTKKAKRLTTATVMKTTMRTGRRRTAMTPVMRTVTVVAINTTRRIMIKMKMIVIEIAVKPAMGAVVRTVRRTVIRKGMMAMKKMWPSIRIAIRTIMDIPTRRVMKKEK